MKNKNSKLLKIIRADGITVIALIVTIVIFLILAGLSLVLSFGQNGILSKALSLNKTNEWSMVVENIKLKLNDYSVISYDKPNEKTFLEFLYEDKYIDLDNIIQIDKIANNSLQYGRGNLEDGDVYYIRSEKLYYKEKNGKDIELSVLPNIGDQLPSYIFWNINIENNELYLDNGNSATFTVSNYDNSAVTRYNLEYSITLLNNSTDLYSIKVDDYELQKNISQTLHTFEPNEKADISHSITVFPKKGAIDTEEKISFKISAFTNGKIPKESEKIIEFNIIPKKLFYNTNLSSNTLELNINNASTSLVLENYQDNNITNSNIDYEISLENKENCPFAVSINNVQLLQSNYSNTIYGKSKNQVEHQILIKKQDNVPITTNEQITLKLIITSPIIIEKTFNIAVKQHYLIDYSGNGYHGKLMNGAEIVKIDNEYALKLDGINDYVELPTLSSSHKWSNGVDINITFRCNKSNYYGNILSLSNTSSSDSNYKDQIIVQTTENDSRLYFEAQTKGSLGSSHTISNTTNFPYNLNQKQNFKVDMYNFAGFYYPLYLNGQKTTSGIVLPVLNSVKNLERKYNYIGKSPWNNNYFNGYIYELLLTNDDTENENNTNTNNAVFYYNLNR